MTKLREFEEKLARLLEEYDIDAYCNIDCDFLTSWFVNQLILFNMIKKEDGEG